MTETPKLSYGLKADTIAAIQAIFHKHPHVIQAILYGSRAKGNYKPASDIDLTLQGQQLDYAELLAIETQLDDLLLPYQIDLSLYEHIDNAALLDHIQRVGIVFYSSI